MSQFEEWQLFSFEDVEIQFVNALLAAVNSPAAPVLVTKTHDPRTNATPRVELTLTTQQNQGQRYLLNPGYTDTRMQPLNVWFFQLNAEVVTNREDNTSFHWPLVGKSRLALSFRKLVPFFGIDVCPLHSIIDIQETPQQLSVDQDGNLDQTKINFSGMIAIRDTAWVLTR